MDGDASRAPAATAVGAWRVLDRPAPSRIWPEHVVLEGRIGGDLRGDQGLAGILQPLLPRPATAATLEALERTGRDPEVLGLALRIDRLSLSLGELQEVRDALITFRKRGKILWTHLSGGGLEELYLASAGDRVLMAEGSQLDVSGFAEEIPMFADFFRQFGITAEFVATGPYKSAVEPYLRNRLSPEARAQMAELLKDRTDQILEGIADARHTTPEALRSLMNSGFVPAERVVPAATGSVMAGTLDRASSGTEDVLLADGLEYGDKLAGELSRAAGGDATEDLYERIPEDRAWSRPRIAIVTLQGTMAQGASGGDVLNGSVLGARDAVAVLEAVRKDESIAGAVVRIESPGGDADAA
ncbi:MAG: hypothetical protein EBU81_15015, partial [Proteobacteria bacterium]|nr:hypothetical protein [Pseudomonadota bacterium]